jgi:hypothetical protein
MQTGYVTPLQWTRGKRQHVYVGDCSSIRIAYSLLLYAMTHMHDSTVRCVVRNGYGPKQGSIGESLERMARMSDLATFSSVSQTKDDQPFGAFALRYRSSTSFQELMQVVVTSASLSFNTSFDFSATRRRTPLLLLAVD